MYKPIILLLTLCLAFYPTFSQHHHRMPGMKDSSQVNQDTSKPKMKHEMGMDTGMHMSKDVPMTHAYSLNLPMNRNGSGTGWLPDVSPMYGYMIHSGKWMYMV